MMLEKFVFRYPTLPLVAPFLNGVIGNLSGIFSSRLSTALHAKREYSEPRWRVAMTLFCMNIPVQIAFMVFIRTMNLGDTSIEGNAFLIGYFLVACTTAGLVLIITKGTSQGCNNIVRARRCLNH